MIDWESNDVIGRQIVEHLMDSILLVKNSLWSKKDEGPSVSALFLKLCTRRLSVHYFLNSVPDVCRIFCCDTPL